MYGDKIGLVPDQRSQKERHGKRDEKSRAQRLFRLCLVGRRKAGNSRLDGTGAQRKSDIVNGKDHLINAEPFRADGSGQEDTVEESEDSREKTCGSEKERAENQGMFSDKINHESSGMWGELT